jgi:enoyl-CoA hydratase/carnithine racemase
VTWCDFVLASDRASFGYPEVRLGIPAIVGAIRLPQRIGWADAMELLLTGETVDAERARQMGLVWRVVPHDDLLDEATALADRLVAGAPLAQRAMKEVAARARDLPRSNPSGSARPCGASSAPPRTPPRGCGPRPSIVRRAGKGVDAASSQASRC